MSLRQEVHDPVKAVLRIKEFSWTLAKLKLLTDESFDQKQKHMAHFMIFLSKVELQGMASTITKISNYRIINERLKQRITIIAKPLFLFLTTWNQDLKTLNSLENMVSLLEIQT